MFILYYEKEISSNYVGIPVKTSFSNTQASDLMTLSDDEKATMSNFFSSCVSSITFSVSTSRCIDEIQSEVCHLLVSLDVSKSSNDDGTTA